MPAPAGAERVPGYRCGRLRVVPNTQSTTHSFRMDVHFWLDDTDVTIDFDSDSTKWLCHVLHCFGLSLIKVYIEVEISAGCFWYLMCSTFLKSRTSRALICRYIFTANSLAFASVLRCTSGMLRYRRQSTDCNIEMTRLRAIPRSHSHATRRTQPASEPRHTSFRVLPARVVT